MTDAVVSAADRIASARLRLAPPRLRPGSAWAGLGAACLAALSSLLLAGAVILGPGFEGAPKDGVGIPAPR